MKTFSPLMKVAFFLSFGLGLSENAFALDYYTVPSSGTNSCRNCKETLNSDPNQNSIKCRCYVEVPIDHGKTFIDGPFTFKGACRSLRLPRSQAELDQHQLFCNDS